MFLSLRITDRARTARDACRCGWCSDVSSTALLQGRLRGMLCAVSDGKGNSMRRTHSDERKKPNPTTPLTREWLRKQGYLVATVEQWQMWDDPQEKKCLACGHQPEIKIRSDLFGVFDLIGFHPTDPKVIVVQTTTGSNHSARKLKVLASMEAKLVLLAGVQVLVQSWTKDVEERWRSREEWITLADYKQAPHYPSDAFTLAKIQKDDRAARRKAKAPSLPSGASLPLETPF